MEQHPSSADTRVTEQPFFRIHTAHLQWSRGLEKVAQTLPVPPFPAKFQILFINAHFVADNASKALASSATVRPRFNDEEEVVVIRNGWTPKEEA